jgi:hypothetical protein
VRSDLPCLPSSASQSAAAPPNASHRLLLDSAARAASALQVEAIHDVLAEPPVRTLAIGRDALPLEIVAIDPRTYALTAFALRKTPLAEPGDEDRARHVAGLVLDRWPSPFGPRAEAGFPELAAPDGDGDGPHGYGSPRC